MKIIIGNREFDFDLGCKLLKLKYEKCPDTELEDLWEDIEPADFAEIAQIQNLENRRVAMDCFGLERLLTVIEPTLISSVTLDKTTMWVREDGEMKEHEFQDTYKLYSIDSKKLLPENGTEQLHFVECKDTSTDRRYLIWVDINSILNMKRRTIKEFIEARTENKMDIDAIDAIAWTFQTTVPKGQIEKIIRQGDCILIKPYESWKVANKPFDTPRHLTGEEYRELLVAES